MTVPVKQTKVGRPSKYSKTLCREVLILLEQGMGIKNATKQCGISYNVWRQWMDKDDKLRDAYYKSKEAGIEMLISSLDERIEDALEDKNIPMSKVKLLEVYAKNVQWQAGKLSSKRYGTEKQTLSITDTDDKKIEISWASD
jgi:hypothetical protein